MAGGNGQAETSERTDGRVGLITMGNKSLAKPVATRGPFDG